MTNLVIEAMIRYQKPIFGSSPGSPPVYLKAGIPVTSLPMISVWMLCVPS